MNNLKQTKQKHLERMKQIELQNIKTQYAIEEEQAKLKKPKKSIQTTKLIVAFLFVNCIVVEVYSMIVMFVLNDLSALSTLVTSIIGEVILFATYCAKSYLETKQSELNKLEREKLGLYMEGDDITNG